MRRESSAGPGAPWERSQRQPSARRGHGRGQAAQPYGPAPRPARGGIPAYPFQAIGTGGEVDFSVSSGATTDTSGNFARHVPFGTPPHVQPKARGVSPRVMVDGRLVTLDERDAPSPAVSSITRHEAETDRSRSTPGSPSHIPTEFGLENRMEVDEIRNTTFDVQYRDIVSQQQQSNIQVDARTHIDARQVNVVQSTDPTIVAQVATAVERERAERAFAVHQAQHQHQVQAMAQHAEAYVTNVASSANEQLRTLQTGYEQAINENSNLKAKVQEAGSKAEAAAVELEKLSASWLEKTAEDSKREEELSRNLAEAQFELRKEREAKEATLQAAEKAAAREAELKAELDVAKAEAQAAAKAAAERAPPGLPSEQPSSTKAKATERTKRPAKGSPQEDERKRPSAAPVAVVRGRPQAAERQKSERPNPKREARAQSPKKGGDEPRQKTKAKQRQTSVERRNQPQTFQIGTPKKPSVSPTQAYFNEGTQGVEVSPSEVPYFCSICRTARWPLTSSTCENCGVKFDKVPPIRGDKGQGTTAVPTIAVAPGLKLNVKDKSADKRSAPPKRKLKQNLSDPTSTRERKSEQQPAASEAAVHDPVAAHNEGKAVSQWLAESPPSNEAGAPAAPAVATERRPRSPTRREAPHTHNPKQL